MQTIKAHKTLTFQEAYNKYASVCSRQECCSFELREKMLRGGMSEDVVHQVLQQLIDEGFINDERYAKAFVHDKLLYSHFGRIRMEMELHKRRISEEDIQTALAQIDADEYQEVLTTILQTYYKSVKAKTQYELYNKLVRYAYSRGFELDVVRETVEQIVGECPL